MPRVRPLPSGGQPGFRWSTTTFAPDAEHRDRLPRLFTYMRYNVELSHDGSPRWVSRASYRSTCNRWTRSSTWTISAGWDA